jgi:ubiquinone biosynthesis protein
MEPYTKGSAAARSARKLSEDEVSMAYAVSTSSRALPVRSGVGGARELSGRVGCIAETAAFGVELLARVRWQKDKRDLGRWMRTRAQEKGPLFVKIMQFASVKGEGLDEEVLDKLRRLQDAVEPFEPAAEQLEVLRSYGVPADAPPISCGSVAAVYRGTDEAGRDVAVKVKRPGVRQAFLDGFRDCSLAFDVLKGLGVPGTQILKDVVTEMMPVVISETDFRGEIRNARRFAASLAGLDFVKVPLVYDGGSDFIVMEYVPSRKLDDAEGVSRIAEPGTVAVRLAAAFAFQLFRSGFFHGDLHPGNVGLTDDGSLVFYDLGSCISLDARPQACFKSFVEATVQNDQNKLLDCLTGLGVVDVTGSTPVEAALIKKELQAVIALLRAGGTHKQIRDIFETNESFTNNYKRIFRPRVEVMYLIRSGGMVDALCKTLDLEFDEFAVAKDILPDSTIDGVSIMREMGRGVFDLPATVRGLSSRIEDLELSLATDSGRRDRTSHGTLALLLILLYLVMSGAY